MTSGVESAKQRVERVRSMLLFWREQYGLGEWDERKLRRLHSGGEVVRIAHGVYLATHDWQKLFPEERLLAATLAQARLNETHGWIFTHESAAVLWQLPLWGIRSSRVHVATTAEVPARSSPRVMRRTCSLEGGDVVQRFGVHCTSLARTVMDLARSSNQELAIGAVDAGLRHLFPAVRGSVPVEVEQWRGEQIELLGKLAGRGTRTGRRIISLADPRADSPAESVSRLQLARLGVATETQVPIEVEGRTRYWVDFEFLGQETLGEIDGAVKYLDERMRGNASPGQVVLAEKAREDEIRGVTGKRIVRWQVQHLRSARVLGERLQRFGVVVPALER